jgi:hypothetical protein
MREGESELQMVQRHVRDGEATLDRQRLLIRRLAASGMPSDDALAMLEIFERTI